MKIHRQSVVVQMHTQKHLPRPHGGHTHGAHELEQKATTLRIGNLSARVLERRQPVADTSALAKPFTHLDADDELRMR